MNTLRLIPILALLFAGISLNAADKLVFKNGDILTGELVSQEDGIITFSSPMLGEIKVPMDDAEVQSPAEIVAEKDGPPEVSEATGIAAAAGGPTLPEGDGDTTTDEEKQAESFDRMIAEWKESFETIIPDGWTGKISVGYTYTNSNSRKTAFIAGIDAKKDSGVNHYSLNAYYQFGDTVAQNGTRSVDTDKYGGAFNYKYDFAEDWFFLSNSSYLKDMVKDIDDQITQNVGVGYRIFDEDDLKLSVNAGVAGQYNDVAGTPQKWYGYATAGNSFEYHFNKYARVEQRAGIRMDPSDTNNYQYNFYLGGIVKLTDWMEASLSYRVNYDNIVGPGTKKAEENIIFALGIPF